MASSDNDDEDEEEEPIEFDDIAGKTSENSTGYSANLTWSMPLQGNWLFRSKLRFNRYEQDITFEGTRFSNIEESTTSMLIGLVHIF